MTLSQTSLTFNATAGGSLPVPQTISVTPSTSVTFAVSAGATWLSVSPSGNLTSNQTLTVSVNQASLGAYSGTYFSAVLVTSGNVTEHSGDPQSVVGACRRRHHGTANIAEFQLHHATLIVPTTSTVVVASVGNAASFAAGAIAPGEIVTIAGSGLGPVSPLGVALDPNGNVADWHGGVSVSFNGYLSPLTYASATQINCVVPYEIDGATDVVVQVNYSGQSGTLAMKTTAVAPAIFTMNGSGSGPAAAANSTGGYNGPSNPAPTGSVITLYLTGEGKTNPAGVTGKVTTVDTTGDTTSGGPLTPQPTAGAPTVTIGGQPATVLFYGEAPGMVAGVMQLNVQVPAGLPSGNLPLVVSFGAASSQSGITVAIQ